MAPHWCDVCRGEDELFKCGGCTRRFHIECVELRARPDTTWKGDACQNPEAVSEAEQERALARAVLERDGEVRGGRHGRQLGAARLDELVGDLRVAHAAPEVLPAGGEICVSDAGEASWLQPGATRAITPL